MYRKVKGTIDYSPLALKVKNLVIDTFVKNAKNYSYEQIETPILEHSELFHRSISSSDIVNKEMYEFNDKGNRSLVLRPELTAPFIRAFIENKWYANPLVNKFYYYGPCFRYEQPQKGRYRQFYQGGVEFIGSKNELKELDVILLAADVLSELGLELFTLKINSIGDFNSRETYKKALREYLLPYKDQLSKISQIRLDKNVLRILDDKTDSKLPFMKNAPKISQYLNDESKIYFSNLLNLLDTYDFYYEIDENLVRGLDYYDEVVFEFVANSGGAQNAIVAGGRYSNLIKELGGPNISSVGFGIGIDRIVDILVNTYNYEDEFTKNDNDIKIFLASTNSKENLFKLFELIFTFRKKGWKVLVEYEPIKIKRVFEKAKKLNAEFVIFDEVIEKKNLFKIKKLNSQKLLEFDITKKGIDELQNFITFNTKQIKNN